VGGGLRSLEDIRQVLRAGADKVSLNTAAVERPELIRDAVQAFGSSTILVSVEAIRRPGGGWEAYTDYGRQSTGLDAVAWARQAEELGAGELLVTSIDQEGTGKGYDLELTANISRRVGIPVIALGGAGSPADVVAGVRRGGADAVSLASVLHYEALARVDSLAEDYSSEGNTTFLAAGGGRPRLEEASLAAVKQALAAAGVDCRPAELVA
jgi:cyclase